MRKIIKPKKNDPKFNEIVRARNELTSLSNSTSNALRVCQEQLEKTKTEALCLVNLCNASSNRKQAFQVQIGIANLLYWNHSDIRISWIYKNILCIKNPREAKKHIKPISVDQCARCGEKITAKSREHQLKLNKNIEIDTGCTYCKSCFSDKHLTATANEDDEFFEDDDEMEVNPPNRHMLKMTAEKKRREELKSMPYQEYLQSDEWQATRKQALRRAGFKCQLCNTGDVVLDVHHRTYENRGNEHYTDIIVLCRSCHSKHHNKEAS